MYYDDLPVWGFIGRVHKAIRRDGSHQVNLGCVASAIEAYYDLFGVFR